MTGPEQVGDVMHCRLREQAKRFTVHLEEPPAGRIDHAYPVGRQQAVGRLVVAQRKQLGERELRHTSSVRRKVPRVPTANIDRRVTRLVVLTLLFAAAVRIVAAIVSGIAALAATREGFPGGESRTGDVLNAFGSAGDTIQALLLLGAAILVWRRSASAAAYRAPIAVLALVSGVLVICRVAGFLDLTSAFANAAAVAQQSVVVGFGLADLAVLGSVLASVRLLSSGADSETPAGDDPVLFAVDRTTSEVFAFFSAAEARRAISTYSVEDDEFAFYDDEGRVVAAEVVDGWTTFTVTDDEREPELLTHLRRFAAEKSLEVDDHDDPLAFVQPINEWQWLELWPGWMRGIGRPLARMRRR